MEKVKGEEQQPTSPGKKKGKVVLGRGLNALLGGPQEEGGQYVPRAPFTASKEFSSAIFQEIAIDQIATNPFQPRDGLQEEKIDSLAASIRTHGIIQPLTVRKLSGDQYQLIAGERRLQASRRAGLSRVPAFVRRAGDQDMVEMALVENIQREDLNPIEIALSYQRLVEDCGLKQEEVGKRMGKDRSTVTNYLRLLSLPPAVQSALKRGEISMGHAKSVLSAKEADAQLAVLKEVVSKKLSVREAERLVQRLGAPKKKKKEKEQHPITQRLSSHYGTKVRIREARDGGGEIRIPFYSSEDLGRILDIMQLS